MNKLIKNKKKALFIASKLGHKLNRFYLFIGFLLSRCKNCGSMVYVSGKPHRHMYYKEISGDAIKTRCKPLDTPLYGMNEQSQANACILIKNR